MKRRHRGVVTGLAVVLGLAAAAMPEAMAREIKSLSGSYLAGHFAAQSRDMEAAARYFTDALAQAPDNPLLTENAFISELAIGNMMRAEQLANRLIAMNGRHRLAHVVLGLANFRRGNQDVARKHFEKAAYTPIGELTSGLLSAWSYAAQHNSKRAFEALHILNRNDSFSIYRVFHEALISDLLGIETKAGELYKKAYDEAGSSLRVVQAYGNFLERSGKTAEARNVYETFLGFSPDHPMVEQALEGLNAGRRPQPFIADAGQGAAEALFGLASALTDEAGIDLALSYARLSLSMNPDFPVAQTLLGDIYESMKQYEAAIRAYDQLPETSPLRTNADVRIAMNLRELDRSDEAKAHLEKIVATVPDNYEALVALGNILRSLSEFGEAATYYTKAIETIAEPEQRHWTAFYFRGISFERIKQWPLAEADFKQALRLEVDQPLVLNYLGYSWVEQGINIQDAFEMIQKAVEQRPNDGYIIDSLGWAYYQLGDYEQAVEELERAIELQPDDPVINDHLGDAYWKVGRRIEARFQWQHARDSEPEPELLDVLKGKLERGLREAPPAPAVAGPVEDKRS